MKGKLASEYPSGCGTYSDLMVLSSPAGWYIGTIHHHEDGFDEPGSRESEYFSTKTEATLALKNRTWHQRRQP